MTKFSTVTCHRSVSRRVAALLPFLPPHLPEKLELFLVTGQETETLVRHSTRCFVDKQEGAKLKAWS
jgi:hypothetical protein